jgi:hypothetical protein
LDPGWVKIRIRDKHPGSATLPSTEISGIDQHFKWTSVMTCPCVIFLVCMRELKMEQEDILAEYRYL